jgi:hypothetical protein
LSFPALPFFTGRPTNGVSLPLSFFLAAATSILLTIARGKPMDDMLDVPLTIASAS